MSYNNFVFYKEWLDQFKVIAAGGTAEDMASLCDGLKSFLNDEEPENVTPLAQLVLNQMTAQIARDKGHYDDLSEKRSEIGKKGAEARWGKAKDGNAMANDSKVCQTIANDGLKEEVEEEVEVSPNGDVSIVCAEPVIGLPLNDGTEHNVTEEDLREYSSLYPAVDVMQQLRNMRGWLLSNPTHRKTKRGIKAFITKWLSKEQDRARSGTTKNTKTMTAEEILNLPAVNPWRYAE